MIQEADQIFRLIKTTSDPLEKERLELSLERYGYCSVCLGFREGENICCVGVLRRMTSWTRERAVFATKVGKAIQKKGYRKNLPMSRRYVRYDNIGRVFKGVYSATSGIMFSYTFNDKEAIIPLSEPEFNLQDFDFGFGEFNPVHEYEPDDEFRMTVRGQDLSVHHEILKSYGNQIFCEYGVYEEANGHMEFLLRSNINDIFLGVPFDSERIGIISFFYDGDFFKNLRRRCHEGLGKYFSFDNKVISSIVESCRSVVDIEEISRNISLALLADLYALHPINLVKTGREERVAGSVEERAKILAEAAEESGEPAFFERLGHLGFYAEPYRKLLEDGTKSGVGDVSEVCQVALYNLGNWRKIISIE